VLLQPILKNIANIIIVVGNQDLGNSPVLHRKLLSGDCLSGRG
jgi:hypothetical protein